MNDHRWRSPVAALVALGLGVPLMAATLGSAAQAAPTPAPAAHTTGARTTGARTAGLSGEVVDARGVRVDHGLLVQPAHEAGVAGATVSLQPLDVSVRTGADGRFTLPWTPTAAHETLRVSRPGFAPWTMSGLSSAYAPATLQIALGRVAVDQSAPTPGRPQAVPAPAETPRAASTCTGWTSNSVPPSTINVLIYADHKNGEGSDPTGVEKVPFETYVEDVLPNEWIASWQANALDSGALAAKTYGWYYAMHSGKGSTFEGTCYDVTDDTHSQRFIAGSAQASTNAAVTATWSTDLLEGGAIFYAGYRSNLTGSSSEACGSGLSAHPNTLSQDGSETCAVDGDTYPTILSTYYPGSALTHETSSSPSFVGMASVPAGNGYWLVGSDGGVFTYGDATFYGSLGGKTLNAPIVGMASTPDGKGYWLVASDGGVFNFGDAGFYGSLGGTKLNAPIVGIASSPDGKGYVLVGSDGGVFTYGDAAFHGSLGGTKLNAPIVGIAVDKNTGGYWLAGADGGVFAYDAPFDGSLGGTKLNAPIVGISPAADGNGYDMVGSDGGVFTYGDGHFYGSEGNAHLNAPIVGISTDLATNGYWLIGKDGGIFSFNAPFYGSGTGVQP
jgi:hypothetical protein